MDESAVARTAVAALSVARPAMDHAVSVAAFAGPRHRSALRAFGGGDAAKLAGVGRATKHRGLEHNGFGHNGFEQFGF